MVYQSQFKKAITQFMRIFSGMEVSTGVDRDGDGNPDTLKVNVYYGDMDRVIANVLHTDGAWASTKLPVISSYMTGITQNNEDRQNPYHTETVVSDGESYKRLMMVPYTMEMDVYLYASNTEQMFQMLEYVLMIFNPTCAFQLSDKIEDWGYLSRAELTNIQNEMNFPPGTDNRVIVWSLQFTIDVYLDFPLGVGDSGAPIIKKAIANYKDADTNFELQDCINT